MASDYEKLSPRAICASPVGTPVGWASWRQQKEMRLATKPHIQLSEIEWLLWFAAYGEWRWCEWNLPSSVQ